MDPRPKILWYYFLLFIVGCKSYENLVEVEKLLGYKPNEKMEEHFMRCMQRYMKESASILRSYFNIELKIAELQRSNDNYKGFLKSCKKLSSKLEGARSGIVDMNF